MSGWGASRWLATFALCVIAPVHADAPWTQSCAEFQKPYRYGGIYPAAMAALRDLAITHRIVRGLDVAMPKLHGGDATVEDTQYTGAVDLSIKCLHGDAEVQGFLSALVDAGFIAWYRAPGVDGWAAGAVPGEPRRSHIHAVWVGDKLKPALQAEVTDWLDGKNGLSAHATYRFWQPSTEQKAAIRQRYESRQQQRQQMAGQSALASRAPSFRYGAG